MIIVQEILVSDEVVEEQFVCNLSACKGACCWEGDSGAPLEADELPVLKAIYPKVKPYLSPAGIAAIEAQGEYRFFEEAEDYGTTLVDNGPCAYMTLNELGIAQCGIERAWRDGVVDFRKPISCQLYPIRVAKNEATGFEALNYDRWDICSAACEKGKAERVPVYVFLKDAIIRKYGTDFYEELDGAAQFLASQKED
jgi:Protein of unknown function (DUF3109)